MSTEDRSATVRTRTGILAIIGPGMLLAATGVGAGDLATGALAGSKLGLAILWAVLFGAALKYLLNEGLTRWQLATGRTLLEGCMDHLGWPFKVLFALYLLFWTLWVCGALMSACGLVGATVLGFESGESLDFAKRPIGILHSIIAVILVRRGGYRLVEQVMSWCVLLMFVSVVGTAILMWPNPLEVLSGLFLPTIPEVRGEGLPWTIALLGGVGGTLTIVCYAYWMREEGRTEISHLKICRWDLASGYLVTAIFGMAVVVVGSAVRVPTGVGSSQLVVKLAEQLAISFGSVGTVAKWMFLLGAWGAVASSLLGVWQCVPYLFADFATQLKKQDVAGSLTQTRYYRGYLYFMASVPIVFLWFRFGVLQLINGVVGAFLMPAMALVLVILNSRKSLVGERWRNHWSTNAALGLAIVFFLVAGGFEISKQLAKL